MTTPSSDLSEEIRGELESIASNLKIAQTKFLTEFSDMADEVDSQMQEHDKNMAKCKDQLESLKENLRQLQDKGMNKRKACEEAEEEMKQIQEKLEQLKEATDEVLRNKEIKDEKVKRLKVHNAGQEEVLASQKKSMAQTAVELEKSVEFFRERLGLNFKKISGDRLQVIFSNLNAKDPSQVCYFCVKLTPNRSYEVTGCEPSVPELPNLIEKLNRTNNFRSFIISIRKHFKQAV